MSIGHECPILGQSIKIAYKMHMFARVLGFVILVGWTVYWGWLAYTETGIYAEIIRRVFGIFGSVDPPFIVFMGWTLGMIVLFIPVLIILAKVGPSQAPTRAPRPHDPSASARRAGVFAFILAFVIGAGAGGAYFYAQTLPDGTDAPQLISASKGLPTGLRMNTKVLVEGDRNGDLGAIVTITTEDSYREIHYVPVVPAGVDPLSVEVQFVEVHRARDRNFPFSVFSDEGYISQEPVELIARDIMAKAGVTLADTTYLIKEISGGPRQEMTIMSYIAMLVAAVAFISGLYLKFAKPEDS